MPELPEVESTRRHLAPVIEGHRIDRIEVGHPRMLRRQPRPADFVDRSRGRAVVSTDRRGKFMLWHLDGDLTIVVHLGMSGRMQVVPFDEVPARHAHVRWRVGDREVRLVDPRTFGFVACLTDGELDDVLSGIGRDALTDLPTVGEIAPTLAGRTAPIKALLLDQRIVAGLGNIYVDEVLHEAAVAPMRPAGSLEARELGAVLRAIPGILEAALRGGGTSLDDLAYLLPDGRAGEYVATLGAYGREGEPCRRCGGTIVRTVLAQRSTHWCPDCQH